MVNSQSIEGVVFDLDGTLIHPAVDYVEMRANIFEFLDSQGLKDKILRERRSIWQLIILVDKISEEKGYAPPLRKEILDKIEKIINAVEIKNVHKVIPIEGAQELLTMLRGRGLKIGIATRSCNAYAREALSLTGLAELVDALLARDDVEYPKPDPRHLIQVIQLLGISLDKIVYMGDTMTDLLTAQEAGVPFIGFSPSPERIERLRDGGCATIFRTLMQVSDFLIKY